MSPGLGGDGGGGLCVVQRRLKTMRLELAHQHRNRTQVGAGMGGGGTVCGTEKTEDYETGAGSTTQE